MSSAAPAMMTSRSGLFHNVRPGDRPGDRQAGQRARPSGLLVGATGAGLNPPGGG